MSDCLQNSASSEASATLISCENLSFAYGGKTVLQGLNFSVHQGDYLCIVGPNGSGKSTLIRGLLRLQTPSAGNLRFSEELSLANVGYLPQQTQVRKDFPASVREVALSGCLGRRGLKPFYSRADQAQAATNLALLGVSDLARRNFGELSGGQQQRVLLARALCAAKKILVLDEPAAGLDLTTQNQLEQLIVKLNREQQMTVVMVSHDVKSALNQAHLLLHLDGEQKFFGTPQDYQDSGVGEGFLGCFHQDSASADDYSGHGHPAHLGHSHSSNSAPPAPPTVPADSSPGALVPNDGENHAGGSDV